MNVTILTPSFNQGQFIEATIRSVLAQNDESIEHVVIDGGSTDGTIEILRRFSHLRWVSERDEGQADALNKGLAMANGEVVGWINSDDCYAPDAIRAVRKAFEDPRVQWVVGDLAYCYEGAREIVAHQSPKITLSALLQDPDIVKQPSTFFRREFLVRAGSWRRQYHMAMDLDLWVRLARISEPRMIGQTLAYFRVHAAQKTSFKNIRKQRIEIEEIMRREGASRSSIAIMRRRKRLLIIKMAIKSALVRLHLLNASYLSRPIRA